MSVRDVLLATRSERLPALKRKAVTDRRAEKHASGQIACAYRHPMR